MFGSAKLIGSLQRGSIDILMQLYQQIRLTADRYQSKFKEYATSFLTPNSGSTLREQLKELTGASAKVVETVRFKLAKKHPSSWVTHLKLTFTLDKFKYLKQLYGERIGLSDEIDD
jgi:phosphoglycerate-specific signal transduction histidine kinase